MKFLQPYRFYMICLLCLSSLISNKAIAQDNLFLDGIDASDLRVWYGVKVGIDLGDTAKEEKGYGNFKLSLRVRTNRNSLAKIISIYDAGFKWEILENVSFRTSFRSIEKVDQLAMSLYSDLSFKKNLHQGLGFQMRGRYQRALTKYMFNQEDKITNSKNEYVLEHRFRPQFKVSKKINSSIKIFVLGELFMDLNKNSLFEVTRERLSLGFDYKYSNSNKVRLCYLFQQDVDKAALSHTINITYILSYKKAK